MIYQQIGDPGGGTCDGGTFGSCPRGKYLCRISPGEWADTSAEEEIEDPSSVIMISIKFSATICLAYVTGKERTARQSQH